MDFLPFFTVFLLVQVLYWCLLYYGFRRAERTSPQPARQAKTPLSVVVAARNEERHLPDLLAALQGQTYANFEVIVVDDASDDATPDVVRNVAGIDGRFRLLRVQEPVAPRKKHALTQGLAAVSHDVVVLTDADCVPLPRWLEALADCYGAWDHESLLLVGYSPFRKGPGLLNRFARYETFITGFFAAAAIGLGKPYTAVGRNLSYHRSVFERIGGFEHSRKSLSGDDDLLVQEVARQKAACVLHLFDPRTFVLTDAPDTWGQWVRQKTRHTSASRFYGRGIQAHLTVFHATGIALWAAPLFLGWVGMGLLGVRLLLEWAVCAAAAPKLGERDLVPVQPFWGLLYTLYNLLVAPLGVLRIPKGWRGGAGERSVAVEGVQPSDAASSSVRL